MWFTPVAFSACSPNSLWCQVAFRITQSGGPIGTLVILLITGLGYTFTQKTFQQKLIVFIKSVAAMLFIFGLFGYINESYTKPILKRHRPSHEYMLRQSGVFDKIDSLYQLTKTQRRIFFDIITKENADKFIQIDPAILGHWVTESGFSFPSGHAFNAFLLALVLAYAIYFNRRKPQWKGLYLVPLLWALAVSVSRVAIGVHTPLDVSTGAALGIAIGLLLLYIDFTRHWLIHQSYK